MTNSEIYSQLLKDAHIAAPWHGMTVYGETDAKGRPIKAAVNICTEEVATKLTKAADRSYKTAVKFVSRWFL